MNEKDLFNSISEIDESILSETEKYYNGNLKIKAKKFRKTVLTVICASILLTAGLVWCVAETVIKPLKNETKTTVYEELTETQKTTEKKKIKKDKKQKSEKITTTEPISETETQETEKDNALINGEEVKINDSDNSKYGYVFSESENGIIFVASYEKDITVLNIPEEIDGYPVVGVKGGYAVSDKICEVNYSKNIKDIYEGGLTFSKLHNCKLNLNEGLINIHEFAYSSVEINPDMYLDEIIFPSTLIHIHQNAFNFNVKKMVFKGDTFIDMKTFSDHVVCKTDIYFSGDAYNVPADAFLVCKVENDSVEKFYSADYATIHYNEGTNGIEKFIERGYKTQLEITDIK